MPLSRCTAIVVTFNSEREIASCLASLVAQEAIELEIHVVDNDSRDGTVELVRQRFPSVLVHANRDNVGFARANNQVLRGGASAYALVNPDTILPSNAVRACLDHLENRPEVGVVGTRLAYPDGRWQPSAHRFLSLRGLLGETLAVERWTGDRAGFSWRRIPGFSPDRASEVDWLQGAFLVVRGDVVRDVGGFDEDFFLYGEEMEWCYRIRRAGWRTAYLPAPTVQHVGGASGKSVAPRLFVENLKGHLLFFRKHGGPLAVTAARALLAFSILGRAAAREAAGAAYRWSGRSLPPALEERIALFRAAAAWVLRGQPIDLRGTSTKPSAEAGPPARTSR